MLKVLALTGLITLAAAGTAAADPPLPLAGGYKYQTDISSDTPFSGYLVVEILAEYTGLYKDSGGVAYWGGSEYYLDFSVPTPVTKASFTFKVPRGYTLETYFAGREVVEYHPITADAYFRSFTGNSPISVVTTQIGTIPEPATWSLLIAGFGFAGVFLRRRTDSRPNVRGAVAAG